MAADVEEVAPNGGRRGHLAGRWAWPCSSTCAAVDDVAYLQFASVYKDFSDAGDFEQRGRAADQGDRAEAAALGARPRSEPSRTSGGQAINGPTSQGIASCRQCPSDCSVPATAASQ